MEYIEFFYILETTLKIAFLGLNKKTEWISKICEQLFFVFVENSAKTNRNKTMASNFSI